MPNETPLTLSKDRYLLEKILLFVGSATFLFGLLYVAGSTILNDPSTQTNTGDIFNGIFLVPLFVTIPLFLIKYGIDKSHLIELKIRLSWIAIITTLGILIVSGGAFFQAYNYLVRTNETIKKQYASFDIIYQKRFDLIPNIAKT